MIVLDASAAIVGLLNDGPARELMGSSAIICPHLVDSEVVHALRSQVLRGSLELAAAERVLDVWRRLGIDRLSVTGLVERMWALRENLSAYDATYVALAEALEVVLVTVDGRLARAPGTRCTVMVLRG